MKKILHIDVNSRKQGNDFFLILSMPTEKKQNCIYYIFCKLNEFLRKPLNGIYVLELSDNIHHLLCEQEDQLNVINLQSEKNKKNDLLRKQDYA